MNAVVQPSQDTPKGAPPASKPPKPRPVAAPNIAAAESGANLAAVPKTNTPPVRRAPKGLAGFAIPDGAYREILPITLRTVEVVKLADSGFAHAHESFYNIEYVLPHYQNENIDRIKETEKSMSALVAALATDLATELKRLRQKAKETGVNLSQGSYVAKPVEVPVASKYAVMLLNILKDLDELYNIAFALSFNSAITSAERVTITSQWRNRVKRFIRSLKHTYVLLKARGELPAEAAGDRDGSSGEELDDLDEAASGEAGQTIQATA